VHEVVVPAIKYPPDPDWTQFKLISIPAVEDVVVESDPIDELEVNDVDNVVIVDEDAVNDEDSVLMVVSPLGMLWQVLKNDPLPTESVP
jgi:hypothetical protein